MTQVQYADEVVAKHVFGELTFGDIWPELRSKCAAIQITIRYENEKCVESRIFHEWRWYADCLVMIDRTCTSLPELPFDSKVRIRENHVWMEMKQFKNGWIEAIFYELAPMELRIL